MTSYQTIETPQDYVNYTFNIGARGITEVAGEMAGLSNTITTILGQLAFKTAEYLTHTETLMIGLGTTSIAAFSSATQEAMKFEQAIANVQAIGGESINAIEIGRAAMQYSNQFAMDVNSMTEGLEALSRAGLTATDVMSGVLAEGVKLSKLEGMDLEESINDLIATTNLLSEEQMDVNSQEYANAVQAMNQHIVSTSESAPINAQNIIQTLQHVGGYASANSIDQDDLFAVIAQLGAKGTKGEMAGTALRAFIAAGQKDQAQRALARIGLDVSDLWDESGNAMLPISEMKQVLDDALETRGFSKQEKLEFYSDFAGYKQANQIMKIDTSEVQEYKKTIAEAWDLGKKLDTILGTTHNNIQTLFQTFKNFMTRVGETTLPIINAIIIPLKIGMQLLDAMPFSENITGMLLAFAGLKTAVLLINRVVPSLAGMYTSFHKSEDRAKGISGHFHNMVKDLEKSKDILQHITDTKYLSSIRLQDGVMGQQSYKQHKEITKWLYSEYQQQDPENRLPWEELSPIQKEIYSGVAEAYTDTDIYQKILDEFTKSNLAHIDKFGSFLIDSKASFEDVKSSKTQMEGTWGKSNQDRNYDERLAKNSSEEIVKTNEEFVNATKEIGGTIMTLSEVLDKKALQKIDTKEQSDITKAILGTKEALAEAIGRAVSQSLDTKEIPVSENLGSLQIRKQQSSGAVKQLQDIEAKVSNNLGDIGYFLDYDKQKIDNLIAIVKHDLQTKVSAYTNDNPAFINHMQQSRMKKAFTGQAKTNLGVLTSTEQNNIDILNVLRNGKWNNPGDNSSLGIRDAQMDKIESILKMKNQHGVERTTRLNNIHTFLQNDYKGDKDAIIDIILQETEKIWREEVGNKDAPSRVASKYLDDTIASFIGNSVGIGGINWNKIENPAQSLINYFNDGKLDIIKEQQLNEASKMLFAIMEQNKAEGEVFNQAEADELGYIIRRYRQLLIARNVALEKENKDSQSQSKTFAMHNLNSLKVNLNEYNKSDSELWQKHWGRTGTQEYRDIWEGVKLNGEINKYIRGLSDGSINIPQFLASFPNTGYTSPINALKTLFGVNPDLKDEFAESQYLGKGIITIKDVANLLVKALNQNALAIEENTLFYRAGHLEQTENGLGRLSGITSLSYGKKGAEHYLYASYDDETKGWHKQYDENGKPIKNDNYLIEVYTPVGIKGETHTEGDEYTVLPDQPFLELYRDNITKEASILLLTSEMEESLKNLSQEELISTITELRNQIVPSIRTFDKIKENIEISLNSNLNNIGENTGNLITINPQIIQDNLDNFGGDLTDGIIEVFIHELAHNMLKHAERTELGAKNAIPQLDFEYKGYTGQELIAEFEADLVSGSFQQNFLGGVSYNTDNRLNQIEKILKEHDALQYVNADLIKNVFDDLVLNNRAIINEGLKATVKHQLNEENKTFAMKFIDDSDIRRSTPSMKEEIYKPVVIDEDTGTEYTSMDAIEADRPILGDEIADRLASDLEEQLRRAQEIKEKRTGVQSERLSFSSKAFDSIKNILEEISKNVQKITDRIAPSTNALASIEEKPQNKNTVSEETAQTLNNTLGMTLGLLRALGIRVPEQHDDEEDILTKGKITGDEVEKIGTSMPTALVVQPNLLPILIQKMLPAIIKEMETLPMIRPDGSLVPVSEPFTPPITSTEVINALLFTNILIQNFIKSIHKPLLEMTARTFQMPPVENMDLVTLAKHRLKQQAMDEQWIQDILNIIPPNVLSQLPPDVIDEMYTTIVEKSLKSIEDFMQHQLQLLKPHLPDEEWDLTSLMEDYNELKIRANQEMIINGSRIIVDTDSIKIITTPYGVPTPAYPQPDNYIDTVATEIRDTPKEEPVWIDDVREAKRMVYKNPLKITKENLEALGLEDLISDWEKGYKAMLRKQQVVPIAPNALEEMGESGKPAWIHDKREAKRMVYKDPSQITKENLESLGLHDLVPDWEKGMESILSKQNRELSEKQSMPSVPVAQMDAISKAFSQQLLALTLLYTTKYFDQTFLEIEALWEDIQSDITNNIKNTVANIIKTSVINAVETRPSIEPEETNIIDIKPIKTPSTVDNSGQSFARDTAIGMIKNQEAYMEFEGYEVGGISTEELERARSVDYINGKPKTIKPKEKPSRPTKSKDVIPLWDFDAIPEEIKEQYRKQYEAIYQQDPSQVPDYVLDILGWQSAEGKEAERKRLKEKRIKSKTKDKNAQQQMIEQQERNAKQNQEDLLGLQSFAVTESYKKAQDKHAKELEEDIERQRKLAHVQDDVDALTRGQEQANKQIEEEYNKKRVQADIDSLTAKQQELEAQEAYKEKIISTISTMKTFASNLDDTTKTMVETRAFKVEKLLQGSDDENSLNLLDKDTISVINELVKDMVNVAETGYKQKEARKDAQSIQAGVEFYESIETLMTIAQQITEQEIQNEAQKNAATGFINIINTLDDIEKELSIQRKNQEESLKIAEELGPQMLETMKHQLNITTTKEEDRQKQLEKEAQQIKDVAMGVNVGVVDEETKNKIHAQYSHINGVNVNSEYEGLSMYERERMKLDHKYGKSSEQRDQSMSESIQRFSIDAREKIDNMAGQVVNKLGNVLKVSEGSEENDYFQQTSDKINEITNKLEPFNNALFKAGEILPPFTFAALAMQKTMDGLTMTSKALWFVDQLRLVLLGEEHAAKEGSIAATILNIVATWQGVNAESALTGARIIGEVQAWKTSISETILGAIRAFIQSSFFLPVIAILATITAAIAVLYVWENKHAEALKESQKALEEATTKNNIALSQYKDLKKARENETDAIKKQQAARKEAIALYELEAARIQRRKAIHDEAELRNDAVWGEYGLRASLQKMGLGFIAGGDFESQYENYDGTTKNIRQIKEATLGNLFATSEQRQVASFYDNNSMFLAEVEAYKEPLQELYDKESKLIEQYGSIDLARGSKEFEEAVQEFADATGVNGETAVKMLDWLETENRVDQASKVGQAEISRIMAERQAKLMEIQYGDQYTNTDFSDIGNAMLMAQFQEMMNTARTEIWWDLLFSYLDAILTGLNPLNWVNGELSKKMAIIGVNQQSLAELNAEGNNIYNDMLEAYENADRKDYGNSGASYDDAPFAWAIEASSTQYAVNKQGQEYLKNGHVMSDEEFLNTQSAHAEQYYGITNEQLRQEKAKQDQELYEKAKEDILKKSETLSNENNTKVNYGNNVKPNKEKKENITQGNTIVIKNININTEDDPEKIKTAFMNLMIELEEQITPRQVSRVVGEAPSASTSPTADTDATNPDASTDPNDPNASTDPNNTSLNNNTNNNPTV